MLRRISGKLTQKPVKPVGFGSGGLCLQDLVMTIGHIPLDGPGLLGSYSSLANWLLTRRNRAGELRPKRPWPGMHLGFTTPSIIRKATRDSLKQVCPRCQPGVPEGWFLEQKLDSVHAPSSEHRSWKCRKVQSLMFVKEI